MDLSKTGDNLFTNEMVDNVLGTQDGCIRATALLYANGRDLKDPFLSPIYGGVSGLPPAILTSGARDSPTSIWQSDNGFPSGYSALPGRRNCATQSLSADESVAKQNPHAHNLRIRVANSCSTRSYPN